MKKFRIIYLFKAFTTDIFGMIREKCQPLSSHLQRAKVSWTAQEWNGGNVDGSLCNLSAYSFVWFLSPFSSSPEHLLTRVGGNLFAAAIFHLNYMIRLIGSKKRKQRMKELAADLTAAAKTKGYSTQGKTDMEKQREKKKVAKPFHGVGMVVPFDKETQVGYRELPGG